MQAFTRHRLLLTDSHAQFCSVGPKGSLEPLSDLLDLDHAFAGEPSHDDCMVGLWIREPSYRHIAISNRLDLEDFAALGNLVKRIVNGLE